MKTDRPLRDRVFEALDNARHNGGIEGWTAEMLAADLVLCCSEVEDEDPATLIPLINAWLQQPMGVLDVQETNVTADDDDCKTMRPTHPPHNDGGRRSERTYYSDDEAMPYLSSCIDTQLGTDLLQFLADRNVCVDTGKATMLMVVASIIVSSEKTVQECCVVSQLLGAFLHQITHETKEALDG